MAELNFESFVEALKHLHEENPTMNIPSLIQTAADTAKMKNNSNINDLSTKQLISAVTNYKNLLKNKRVAKPGRNVNGKSLKEVQK